jgi:uncharacterized FAD-dependent dehydrogenase
MMNADVVIIGAAGIFTALEMIKKGSKQKIIMVEKGQAVENRHCPKDKTKKCVNCKPYCHITTGFSGAGAFSDGKLSLSYEVGGDLPRSWHRRPSITLTRSIWISVRTSTLRVSVMTRSARRSASTPFRQA